MTFPTVVRGRVNPSFAGYFSATSPLVQTKSGLTYTTSLNFGLLSTTASIPVLSDVEVITRSVATGALTRVLLSDLPTGATEWDDIQDKPTTLSGYGITDAAPSLRAINTTAPLQGGGALSSDRTLSLANSGVTAGSYTTANITVDALGRVTAAASGTAVAALPRGYIAGLILSNNVTDATNDIDISAGEARNSTNLVNITLASALTKRLDAAWAVGTGNGGLDTGSIANTTYHVYLIRRSDTGVVDAIFSTSASGPTMPTSHDSFRRIGSIVRASAAIEKFLQDGDWFYRETPVRDVSATNPGTSAVTRTLSVPVGVKVRAQMVVGGSNASTNWYGLMSSLDAADIAPSSTVYNCGVSGATFSNSPIGYVTARTNTSAQIRSRISASGASDILQISTIGWVDERGKGD